MEQEGRRKGYCMGPMAYTLTAHGPYRKDLVSCAEPFVRDLARTTGESTLVAIVHQYARYTICSAEGGQQVQVRAEGVLRGKVYPFITGRLLLAHMPSMDLDKFVEHVGLPDSEEWPEALTRQNLLAELASLKSVSTAVAINSGEVAGLAHPITGAGGVVAALGIYLPVSRFNGAHKKALPKAMKIAADAISERLKEMHAPSKSF